MSVKHFKIVVTLFLCASTFFLQGCSVLGIGESEYACEKPGKGVCKSARQVYRDTDLSTIEPITPPQPPTMTKAEPDLNVITPESIPNRLPAQILRIWIAPWVDKQGNWHSGGVVMTDIYPREWQSAVPIYTSTD